MEALDGILVVSLEQAVAAPYCTRLLSEAGARVIKIERDGGDFARHYDTAVQGDSAYFVWLNTGKESIVVDLRAPDDLALVKSMLAEADVFLQNFRPGAVDRLGLGYDDIAALNPRLVMCSISGYGLEGPYTQKKAYDFLVQGESGLVSVTGHPGEPARVGISVCDISTGQAAYGEILRALIKRDRNGRGEHLDVSLFDVMAEWMNVPLSYYKYAGRLLGGTGVDHTYIAPYGVHETADGPIILAVQHDGEWRDLCEKVLERPELARDPRFATNPERVANRPALTAEIERFTREHSREVVGDKLEAGGIAYGFLNDCSTVWAHPALKTRQVISAGNESTMVRRVGDRDPAPRVVPDLDQHGAALRREFAPVDR